MGKGGKGKRKGSKQERKICWALSRFIDPNGEDTIFWRSAMSGGRATVQSRKGIKNTNQAGDITCIDERGAWLTDLFCIESKFYKSLDLEASLLLGKGKLAAFWRSHYKVSKSVDRAPLLIARQNRTPTLVILDAKGLSKFRTYAPGLVEAYPVVVANKLNPPAMVYLFDKVFKPKATRGERQP